MTFSGNLLDIILLQIYEQMINISYIIIAKPCTSQMLNSIDSQFLFYVLYGTIPLCLQLYSNIVMIMTMLLYSVIFQLALCLYSRVQLPLVFEVLDSILMAFEVEHSISSLSPNEMKNPHSRWSFFVSYSAENPKYSLKRMFTSLQFDPKRTIENC